MKRVIVAFGIFIGLLLAVRLCAQWLCVPKPKIASTVSTRGDAERPLTQPVEETDFCKPKAKPEDLNQETAVIQSLESELEGKSNDIQFEILKNSIAKYTVAEPNLACAASAVMLERFPDNEDAIRMSMAALQSWYASDASRTPYPDAGVSMLRAGLAQKKDCWRTALMLIRSQDQVDRKLGQNILNTAGLISGEGFYDFLINTILARDVGVREMSPKFENAKTLLRYARKLSDDNQTAILRWLSDSPTIKDSLAKRADLLEPFLNSPNTDLVQTAKGLCGEH